MVVGQGAERFRRKYNLAGTESEHQSVLKKKNNHAEKLAPPGRTAEVTAAFRQDSFGSAQRDQPRRDASSITSTPPAPYFW